MKYTIKINVWSLANQTFIAAKCSCLEKKAILSALIILPGALSISWERIILESSNFVRELIRTVRNEKMILKIKDDLVMGRQDVKILKENSKLSL